MADARVVTEDPADVTELGFASIPIGEIKQGNVVVGRFSPQEPICLWLCVRERMGRGQTALFLGMDKDGRITGPLRDTYISYGQWWLVSSHNMLEPCDGDTYEV